MKKVLLFLFCALASIGTRAEDFSSGGSITIDETTKTATVTVTQEGAFSTWLSTAENAAKLAGVTTVKFSSESKINDNDLNKLSDVSTTFEKIDATGCYLFASNYSETTITITNAKSLVLDNIKNYTDPNGWNSNEKMPIKITGCDNMQSISMKGANLIINGKLSITNNKELATIELNNSNIVTKDLYSKETILDFAGNPKLQTLTLSMVNLRPMTNDDNHIKNLHNNAKIDISNCTSLKGIITPEGITEENVTKDDVTLDYIVTVTYSTKAVTAHLYNGGHIGDIVNALNISGETEFQRMNIVGELNSDDFTAMESTNIQIPIIDLSKRTVAEGTPNEHYNFKGNTYVKYAILPPGWSTKEDDFEGCTSLKVALSFSEDQTELNAYVTEAGGLRAALDLTDLNTATLTKATLSGNLNGADISNATTDETIDGTAYQPALSNAKLAYLDLKDAIFNTYENKISFSPIADGRTVEEETNGLSNISQYRGTLVTLKLPTTDDTTILPAGALKDCTKLEDPLNIPDNIKFLGSNACYGLDVSSISIGGVEKLGVAVFSNCTNLSNVSFPSTMEHVPAFTFNNCGNLAHVTLPEGLTTIEKNAFAQTKISSIYLPTTLTTIEESAFYICNSLKTITIPANVATIGSKAFYGCRALTDVYVLGTEPIPAIAPDTFDESSLFGGGNGLNTEYQKDSYVCDEAYTKISGNNLCIFHYPISLNETDNEGNVTNPYTDVDRNSKYSYYAVTSLEGDLDANKVPVEGGKEGEYLRRPNYTEMSGVGTKYKTEKEKNPASCTNWWQYFALAQGYTTGGDNSTVWTVRHMSKDVWYTMCFPFDITRDQLEDSFNYGCELATFAGTNTETIDGKEYTYLDFTTDVFDWDKEMDDAYVVAEAGHPYMIHPASGTSPEKGTSTVFTISGIKADYTKEPVGKTVEGCGYTFIGSYGSNIEENGKFVDVYNEYPDATADNDGFKTYTPGKNGMPEGLLVPKPIEYGWYFLGTKAGEIYPKFFRQTSTDMNRTTGLWTRFTAMVKPVETTYGAREMGLAFGIFDDSDVVITRIKDIDGNVLAEEVIGGKAVNNNVYDITGKLVRSGSTSLDGLPKGIYIVNGRKYVVE